MGQKRNGSGRLKPATSTARNNDGFSDVSRLGKSNSDATSPQGDDMNESAWKTLVKAGPWAVMTGVLVGVFIFDVRVGLTEGREQHTHLINSVDAVKEIAGQSDMAQQQILYVLQTLCVNAAKTEVQRDDCQRRIDTRNR